MTRLAEPSGGIEAEPFIAHSTTTLPLTLRQSGGGHLLRRPVLRKVRRVNPDLSIREDSSSKLIKPQQVTLVLYKFCPEKN
jgi:hypothetical protein